MIVSEEKYNLIHYGVPGMKWGVRRDRRVETLRSASKPGASKAAKARAAAALIPFAPVDVVKGRGVKGGAARRASRQEERNSRIRLGKSTVRDQMVYYGGTRFSDVIPVRTKNIGKPPNPAHDKYYLTAVGLNYTRLLLGLGIPIG